MRLYYHKTDGGAEYLFDTFIECENGHLEGVLNDDTKYVVRIDGDIEKDAELTVVERKEKWVKCWTEHKSGAYGGCSVPHAHKKQKGASGCPHDTWTDNVCDTCGTRLN